MSVKIEDNTITADTQEEVVQELERQWPEICRCAVERTLQEMVQIQQREDVIEKINQALLLVAASIALTFPVLSAYTVKLHILADAYVASLGF